MGLGDFVHTKQSVPYLLYRKATAGYAPVGGDPVYFVKTTDDIQLATASTDDGPVYILSNFTHVIDGVTYYGVAIEGDIVALAGGAINVGKKVIVGASKKFTELAELATPTASGNNDAIYKSPGIYVGLESDNQYAQSEAADTNLIVIHMGGN